MCSNSAEIPTETNSDQGLIYHLTLEMDHSSILGFKELAMNSEVHQEENGEINYDISTQQILGRLNKKRGRRDHFENW